MTSININQKLTEININNIKGINKESNNNKFININNNSKNEEEINQEEEGSFQFNKNSFFFNNANNVLLVNIDNNSEYDETEIKRINLKKNFYTRYTTNIIKININNTKFDIINKKIEKNNNICLTEKNSVDKKMRSKFSEENKSNNIFEQKGNLTARSEKEKTGYKIEYKIIHNNNNKNKVINAAEKTSFDDSVDEIINKHLVKIHNNNNEINKQRIDKAYNQLKKSQNSKNNIYNNFGNESNKDNEKEQMMKKSKSSGSLNIKSDIDLNED